MAQCKVLLNTGDYLLLNSGDNVLLNDNSCTSGTAHGVWDGGAVAPEIIKPWKEKQEAEESTLELLIVAQPIMGQLFKTDLSLLPYLKQYADQLYDILLNPIKLSFNEFKIVNGAYKTTKFLNASIEMKYESPTFSSRPYKEQMFRKTLYGEKLHGLQIIEMVKELMGISSLDFSDAQSIRPDITISPTPDTIAKGDMLTLSVRLYYEDSSIPLEVSKIFMSIISVDDGHEVWPLEVIRKNTAGFDILIGTSEMKVGHEYLVRVSNNQNLSPSASTTFKIKGKKVIPFIIPLIPLLPTPAIREPTDDLKKKEIEVFIFRTQMDHRVCPICKEWENRVFYPDEDKPIIPDDTHPRCRCTYDIVFKEVEE